MIVGMIGIKIFVKFFIKCCNNGWFVVFVVVVLEVDILLMFICFCILVCILFIVFELKMI